MRVMKFEVCKISSCALRRCLCGDKKYVEFVFRYYYQKKFCCFLIHQQGRGLSLCGFFYIVGYFPSYTSKQRFRDQKLRGLLISVDLS